MVAFYNEIDPFVAAWLRELIARDVIAPGIVDERSIEDVCPDELAGFTQCHFFAGISVHSYALRRAGWPDDRPIWTGSCPCQPFSAAGKGEGFADERHLWPAFYHLIEQCEPTVVAGEQVASGGTGVWFDLVQADLEAMGYAFGLVPLPAAGFGGAHIRDRAFWLADAAGHGWRQECQNRGWGVAGIAAREAIGRAWSGDLGGMADAVGSGPLPGTLPGVYRGEGGAGPWYVEPQRPGGTGGLGHNSGSSAPMLGRDAADWLFCRDGKWRPVESIHVKMVDAPAADMGRVCDRSREVDAKEAERLNAILLGLRKTTPTQDGGEPGLGISVHVREAEILRPGLHGGGIRGQDQGSERQELAAAVGEGCGAFMRGVRSDGEAACPPSGRGPHEQLALELADVVRLLPPSLALAELHGDRRTESALRALLSAIREEGAVRDASLSPQEIWASLGEEAKSRLGLGFDAARWELLAPHPLTENAPARVGRLRGYGNAIDAVVAEEFYRALIDILPEA